VTGRFEDVIRDVVNLHMPGATEDTADEIVSDLRAIFPLTEEWAATILYSDGSTYSRQVEKTRLAASNRIANSPIRGSFIRLQSRQVTPWRDAK
jgi:hypothetical protein